MDPRVLELLDVAFRWVHVIAGIMWIGNSLLFNWLDRNLLPPSRSGEGRQGEIWLLHSGGFYFVEKTALAGQPLPRPLHWFKWQAYITWLSGAALLITVYYVGGRALLVDPSKAALSPWAGVALGAGAIVGGWIVYDVIWRFVAPRSSAAAAALSVAALTGVVVLLTSLMSGRAAFLHAGAMLGTIMAANVGDVIMPSQRELVDAVAAGRGADPAVAARAKTRSIHNNYLTFPVIVLMLSSHFPGLYGHRLSWLLLLVLVGVGAGVRHLLNIRFTSRWWVPALGATVAAAFLALWALGTPSPPRDGAALAAGVDGASPRVAFADVRSIIDRRCTPCHSASPSITEMGPAPASVPFDTPQQIGVLAERIRVRAVDTETMPPGNRTRMTERERVILGAWVTHGATLR